MSIAPLIAAGGLVLARKISDVKATRKENKALLRSLPPVPETSVDSRWASDNGCASSENELLVSTEPSEARCLSIRTTATATTTDDGLPSPYLTGVAEHPRPLASHPLSSDELSSISPRYKSSTLSLSTTSSDAQDVRVRTKGDDLKSGFPYHPRLYDLKVRPDDWERFIGDVTHATRFGTGDYAKMWAAAGSVALTGSVMTSAWVGRTINRSIQEKKVSVGLTETSEGSLGDVLQQWNELYFAPLGLCTRLELSDSALRQPKQKSRIIRRPSLTYISKEERERKEGDRKFVIIVAELVNNDIPTEVHELMGEPDRAKMPRGCTSEFGITELPTHVPIELPAESVEKTGLDDIMKTA